MVPYEDLYHIPDAKLLSALYLYEKLQAWLTNGMIGETPQKGVAQVDIEHEQITDRISDRI